MTHFSTILHNCTSFYLGYKTPLTTDVLLSQLPSPDIYNIDHIVGNQPDLTMEDAAGELLKIFVLKSCIM